MGTICRYCKHCCGISYNLGGCIFVDCKKRWDLDDIYHDTTIHEELKRISECDDFKLPRYNQNCWDNGMLKPKYLPKIRKEISLGSMYIDDYNNSFGIKPELLCDFFDEYLTYLGLHELEDSPETLIDFYDNHTCTEISQDWVIDEEYVQNKV